MWSREYFKRDHEKLVIVDNKYTMGSANVSSHYGGKILFFGLETALNAYLSPFYASIFLLGY